MKIIVDANIVFSAILNTKGKIGDILINSKDEFNFIAPEFLKFEIRKHYSRLSKISKLSLEQIQEAETQICKEITFISEEQIPISIWKKAEKLVIDIDPNDIQYIAYSIHFKCKIWSGDKALFNGLSAKGFHDFFTTNDLFNLRKSIES